MSIQKKVRLLTFSLSCNALVYIYKIYKQLDW